jgi:D-lactate dehydrogenase
MKIAVYDTKSYDRQFLKENLPNSSIDWEFHEFRLSAETALSADGAKAVCVFVNDKVDESCLKILAEQGVKLVVLRCAGYNNIDLAAAKALGLAVTRVPAYSPHAVAEHAAALLLTLNRKTHRAYNRVREHNFSLSGLVGFDIFGKTIGIVGTGKIGKIAAQIFRGFGARILAQDAWPDRHWAEKNEVEYVSPEHLFSTSDIISLHVPLHPETYHLLREETFSLMKDGVIIINTGRGKLIETKCLIAGLKSGHIGGVALDVYEEEEGIFFEDLSDRVLQDDELSRLLTFPNVLITAHQAFLTREALAEIARVTIANLLNLESGAPFLEGTVLSA